MTVLMVMGASRNIVSLGLVGYWRSVWKIHTALPRNVLSPTGLASTGWPFCLPSVNTGRKTADSL